MFGDPYISGVALLAGHALLTPAAKENERIPPTRWDIGLPALGGLGFGSWKVTKYRTTQDASVQRGYSLMFLFVIPLVPLLQHRTQMP